MKAQQISDLTHEGLFDIFGDFLHEVPEVVNALRQFAYQSRPASVPDGCKIRIPQISVKGGFHLRFGERSS